MTSRHHVLAVAGALGTLACTGITVPSQLDPHAPAVADDSSAAQAVGSPAPTEVVGTPTASTASPAAPSPDAPPMASSPAAPTPTPTPTTPPAPISFPNLSFGEAVPGGDARALALTFDDGPDGNATGEVPTRTDRILDVLKAEQVPAAFFVCGEVWSKLAIDPVGQASIKRMVAEGHLLGLHTMDHLDLSQLSAADVDAQFSLEQVLLGSSTLLGDKFSSLVHLARAPYGRPFQYPDAVAIARVQPVIERYGVHIGWNLDIGDWRCAGQAGCADQIVRTFVDGLDPNTPTGDGSAKVTHGPILLHMVWAETATALPRIIAEGRRLGYRFVSVDDILKEKYGATAAQIMAVNRAAMSR